MVKPKKSNIQRTDNNIQKDEQKQFYPLFLIQYV